ncbi:MAG: endonuclease III [Acidobacteriota bacterium]|nr:endonuclease III [Acidobacteriota bacterium]
MASRLPTRIVNRVMRDLGRIHDIHRFKTENGSDPFRILIGCIISLRTKDEVTYPATERLFRRADTPHAMARLHDKTIARLIYPAGFFNRKAVQIKAICHMLVREFGGDVPSTMESLLRLPGVGRKTANLVITLGFDLPGICVDVHVHRICNRLGWIESDHPDTTEALLRESLDPRHWIPINETMVRHGQATCKPVSPLCTECVVANDCPRIGVGRSR